MAGCAWYSKLSFFLQIFDLKLKIKTVIYCSTRVRKLIGNPERKLIFGGCIDRLGDKNMKKDLPDMRCESMD
jgi:hypothetical protein